MWVGSFDLGHINAVVSFLQDNRRRLLYTISFFLLIGLGSIYFPTLRPIVAAAFLVLPLQLIVRLATAFDEQDYEQFSPILQNLDNVRFLLVSLSFFALPLVSWYFDTGFGWAEYGTIGRFMVTASVGVFIWSEGAYMKNFYFDRWHLVERSLLILSGLLVLLLGPVFTPLFLLAYRVIIHQFDFPDIGGFMGTHSRLPLTVLRITGAFAFVCLFLSIQPSQMTFLLFCGYSAHYFHPGFAKLINNGFLYYLRNNNPFYLFLNAYALGFMNFLDEEIVIQVGKYTDKIKLAINLSVILIEIGAILVIVSHPIAIIILFSTFLLHLLILVFSGVNFWKWMTVEIFGLLALVLFNPQTFAYFGNPYWAGLFGVFVIFARAWMNPVGMDWLDSSYTEFYEFVGEMSDGNKVKLHPNIFRPYDPIVAQGAQGGFTFLGNNPKITYCLGGINNEDVKDLHSDISSSIGRNTTEINKCNMVENLGEHMKNDAKSKSLNNLLTRFLQNEGYILSFLRFISSPREFYTNGISERESYSIQADLTCIRVYRIDGIWMANGFDKLSCEEVLTIQS
jgi:hypothetical protein